MHNASKGRLDISAPTMIEVTRTGPHCAGRYVDRAPQIPPAGKLYSKGDKIVSCPAGAHLRPITPPDIAKMMVRRRPNVGAERIWYGRANDPDTPYHMTHGISSRSSHGAALLLNPPLKTLFQKKLLDRREAYYSSCKTAPLGKSHNQRLMLPPGTDPDTTTFGCTLLTGESGGEIINPRKSYKTVKEESKVGHELYIVSHNDYHPGEMKNRKYDWSKWEKGKSFGIDTPHFIDGRHAARSLRWLHECQVKEAAKLVSKRFDDYNDKFQHILGKVNDPIAETMNVSPDHTFGLIHIPDKYGVREILHYTPPMNFLLGKERHKSVLAAIRQHLKKVNYTDFNTLMEAFRHYDQGDGKIEKDDLNTACIQSGLHLHPELVDALVEYCDVDECGLISFTEFANLLNWKDRARMKQLNKDLLARGKIPPDGLETAPGELEACSEDTPKTLTKPTDRVGHAYRTTSSAISAIVGGPSSARLRRLGIPSIRTDIPAPVARRVDDKTNYGDDTNAYALLCPSIYSENGVYEEDFFKSRSKEELNSLLCAIGVSLPGDTFDEIWNLATERHPKGEVCIETMRNLLDEIQGGYTLLK